MADPKTQPVVVALVTNAKGEVLVAWNAKWGGFSLPMTKPDTDGPPESVEEAAVRAAAEVAHRPVRLVSGGQARTARDLLLGGRDKQVKNYVYAVVRVELHPDFAGASGGGFWADPTKLDGEYAPLTDSVAPLIAECREWKWVR